MFPSFGCIWISQNGSTEGLVNTLVLTSIYIYIYIYTCSDLTFSCKGMQSWYIILPIQQLLLMDEMFENYKKTCFNNSERIFKTFFNIVFLEICKSFELLPKGLSTKKRLCFGKPSEELEKEWKNGIDELDGRCRDLLLQEHCKKLFNLMDIFWCDIILVWGWDNW